MTDRGNLRKTENIFGKTGLDLKSERRQELHFLEETQNNVFTSLIGSARGALEDCISTD